MLEITILLEILLHRIYDGIGIAGLLICSSMLSFLQEYRSKRALRSLLNKLSPNVRVLRDGV